MTKRITALISPDHSYEECEIQLNNTMYLLHSTGDYVYATVDFSDTTKDTIVEMIADDLLALGLLTETISINKVQ